MSKERTQPLPVRAGSVIVFSRHLMHGAMPNLGNSVRMSLDLRYQHPDAPSGRGYLPGFIARSRSNPSSELRDHHDGAALDRGAQAARGPSAGVHGPALGHQPPALRVGVNPSLIVRRSWTFRMGPDGQV